MFVQVSNGEYIIKLDAVSTWKDGRSVWMDLFGGASEYINTKSHKQASLETYESSEEEFGTMIWLALYKAHEQIGKLERSHAYMYVVHDTSRIELPIISREKRLLPLFRALNNTAH